jgi:probable 2-oxoglutarate dehydrogenase E1 component DHKTD1
MGIAHRGRLNLMIGLLNLDPALLFAKMKGKSEFSPNVTATGDISHHFRKKIHLI